MVPPMGSMMRRQSTSPSPEPPKRRVLVEEDQEGVAAAGDGFDKVLLFRLQLAASLASAMAASRWRWVGV